MFQWILSPQTYWRENFTADQKDERGSADSQTAATTYAPKGGEMFVDGPTVERGELLVAPEKSE